MENTKLSKNYDDLRCNLILICLKTASSMSDIRQLTDDSILRELDNLKSKLIDLRGQEMYSRNID